MKVMTKADRHVLYLSSNYLFMVVCLYQNCSYDQHSSRLKWNKNKMTEGSVIWCSNIHQKAKSN